MKIRRWFPAFIAPLVFAALPLPAPAQTDLKVEKIAEGVWVATPERGANVGWFLSSDGVVAIDSGNDAEIAKAVLAKIAETAGKPVRYVVVTHAHGDHASGVPVFAAAGARVICQENAAPAIAALLRGGKAPDPKVPEPGVLAVSDRLTFFGGGQRATAYYLGPGHTNGDLVVLIPDEKILFSGDLVSNSRLPYLQSADADPRGWEEILKRLAALDVERVVPGHGTVGTRQSISDSHVYIRKVNELATEFIRTRVPDELYEMKLREPDNRIENVPVSADHIANVRAAVKIERARLERVEKEAREAKEAKESKPSRTPGPKPTPKPPAGKKAS